ncbi:MAG TPA: hypothetical protein VGM11_04225 [Acidobacteriaceae bacterium]
MRNTTKSIAFLFAALVLTGIGAAQTASPSAVTASGPETQETTAGPEQSSSAQQEEAPNVAPVFWITSVEVMRSTHAPQLDVVRARGLVTTSGWEAAQLVPITKGVPTDGVLDLALIAEVPAESTTSSSYTEIEAIFTIEPGHPFRGVRVHSASNRVALKMLPGYAEAGAPPKNCVSCTGKLFVPKGQTAPTNRAVESVVREEDLPHNLRVIRESDGVAVIDSDPNRLTLLLGENGEIVAAMWD